VVDVYGRCRVWRGEADGTVDSARGPGKFDEALAEADPS